MIRSVVAAFFFLVLLVSGASAQCVVPNTFVSGTTASAAQVNANFAALLSCVNSQAAPRSYLAGLTLSTAGGSANFGIAAGVATSDDTTTSMPLATPITKTTSAWTVGTGNGSLDIGSITNGDWYHVFLIERTDTGVVDILTSLSATSPTLPASYTEKRRIGSMKADGSGHWTAFIQDGDIFRWSTSVADVNAVNPGTSAVTRILTVPTGVRVQADFAVGGIGTSGDPGPEAIFVSDLSLNDQPASQNGAADFFVYAAGNGGLLGYMGRSSCMTNILAQVRTRVQTSTATTTLTITTHGWTDRRGRDL